MQGGNVIITQVKLCESTKHTNPVWTSMRHMVGAQETHREWIVSYINVPD